MKVEISENELVDRLRAVQSRLTEQNEHSDALFIEFAIQSITSCNLTSQPFLRGFCVGGQAVDAAPGGVTIVNR